MNTKTIMMSEIGALDSVLLKRMDNGVAVLTSYGIPEAVALPYVFNKESIISPVEKYISIDYDDESLLSAARLKAGASRLVKTHKVLIVLRHNAPVAVLLPAAYSKVARQQYALLYLQAIGYDDIQLPALQSDINGDRC